jgi:anhydro-N-acetylmuramic acid kinase
MANSDLYIGLISGTSVDGVDCALVEFDGTTPKLVHSHFSPTDSSLRARTLRLCSGAGFDLAKLGELDVELGRVFASGVKALLASAGIEASTINAIGSHGQTVWHQPSGDYPFTLQIADPNVIAQETGITTVADFRRRDIAAGGQGAPLAPLLHRNFFASRDEDRVVLNIGGFSNITVLRQDGSSTAFDTGPGNVLMDYWIGKNRDQKFDANGDWAGSGAVDQTLLATLLEEPYFALPHPKSTGRELFNGPWLEAKLQLLNDEIDTTDVQATLLKFTVETIANDIKKLCNPKNIFVCGGGVHNGALMEKLQQELPNSQVCSSSVAGIDPDWVEAIAFAWMAKQTIEGNKIDSSAFTGADLPIILGGIYQA